MHPLREQARQLRQQGKSYGEIEECLGIGRSTLSYMLRDIQLTASQQARLELRQQQNRARFGSFWHHAAVSEQEARRKAARQAMLNYWSARTDLEKEQFQAKVRLVAVQRHNVYDPSQSPQTLDMVTYQMCLRAAPLLGCHPNWNYVTSRGVAVI